MRLRRLSPFHLTNALQAIVDAFLLLLAWALAFWLRFNLDVPEEFERLALVSSTGLCPGLRSGPGCLRAYTGRSGTYIGLPELRQLAAGVVLGAVLTTAGILMLRLPDFPRSVLLLQPCPGLRAPRGGRAAWRTCIEHPGPVPRGPAAARRRHPAGCFRRLARAQRLAAVGARRRSSRLWPPNSAGPCRECACWGASANFREMCRRPACACRAGGQPARICGAARGADAGRRRAHQPAAYAPTRRMAPRPIPKPCARSSWKICSGREPVALDVAGLAELFSGQNGAGHRRGRLDRLGAVPPDRALRRRRGWCCVDVSEYAIYQLEQELRQAHPQMQGVYYTANVREYERLRRSLPAPAGGGVPCGGVQARAADGGAQRDRGAAHQRARHAQRGARGGRAAARADS